MNNSDSREARSQITGSETLLYPMHAAQILRISMSTLSNWRRKGIGPPFIVYPGGVRYRLSDLRDWLNEQTKNRIRIDHE